MREEASVAVWAEAHSRAPSLARCIPVQELPGVQIDWTPPPLGLEMVVETLHVLALAAALRASALLKLRAPINAELQDRLRMLRGLLRAVQNGNNWTSENAVANQCAEGGAKAEKPTSSMEPAPAAASSSIARARRLPPGRPTRYTAATGAVPAAAG
eukprot:CAMPEP_0176054752 /NCGR_PEP_ID=MMETSP0120_2-20121206/27247_1 /TAXON_ID=160619 /ORGANISM="Kryptoperidinium foliaceum, Strain CCMP 1326" /LENGTH=156 /DNA_ID=CAMNT_0017388227 /DNA_START=237 /DNA_END=704 /DNA_ORIENTATION=-